MHALSVINKYKASGQLIYILVSKILNTQLQMLQSEWLDQDLVGWLVSAHNIETGHILGYKIELKQAILESKIESKILNRGNFLIECSI